MTLQDFTDIKLSPLQLRWLLLDLLKHSRLPTQDEELPATSVAAICVADLLQRRVGFLAAEQRQLILQSLAGPTCSTSAFAAIVENSEEPVLLALLDCRWFVHTGRQGCLDLQTGEERLRRPYPSIESLGYNLSELYRRKVSNPRDASRAQPPVDTPPR